MCEEYLQWCVQHPAHLRMVRGHIHKLITVCEGGGSSRVAAGWFVPPQHVSSVSTCVYKHWAAVVGPE
jgi:hypothetical protein